MLLFNAGYQNQSPPGPDQTRRAGSAPADPPAPGGTHLKRSLSDDPPFVCFAKVLNCIQIFGRSAPFPPWWCQSPSTGLAETELARHPQSREIQDPLSRISAKLGAVGTLFAGFRKIGILEVCNIAKTGSFLSFRFSNPQDSEQAGPCSRISATAGAARTRFAGCDIGGETQGPIG